MKKLTSALVAVTISIFATQASARTSTSTYINPVTNAGVQETVQSYFSDLPVMARIARCESGFKHFDAGGPNGLVTNPNPRSSASGVFQILLKTHGPEAAKLGLDIKTVDGQLRYARHLYEQNGTRDWNASRNCWG